MVDPVAIWDFPDVSVPLETEQGLVYHQKTDVFKRLMWYSSKKEMPSEVVCLSVDKVKEIIAKNKKGEKVKKLESIAAMDIAPILDYQYKLMDEESGLANIEDSPPEKKPHKKHRKKRR